MDERELRAMHRAAQPILQRTAPVQPQGQRLTPPVLDEVAWCLVLAYVANVSRRPPREIPPQVRDGAGPLPAGLIDAALAQVRRAQVRPRLVPERGNQARFEAAARRLLGAYGWSDQRAAQAAGETAAALRAAAEGVP